MEYTVQKLGQLAEISTRTLRYYDEIGILKPARINSSGYRIYGQNEVNKLQQILFYKELGVSLEVIKEIIDSPTFDPISALVEHRQKLLNNREQINQLLANIEKTIAAYEGSVNMQDKEKFEGFKQKMIDDNEEKYGEEIRSKYGDDTVNQSYKKLRNMTEEEHKKIQKLADEIHETLKEAFKKGNPSGELAQKAADLHRQWICFYWDHYSKEAHAGLAQMYVDDERFTSYYDKEQPGTAKFLRDAIFIYTGVGNSS